MAFKKISILIITAPLFLTASVFSEPKYPEPYIPNPKDAYWRRINPAPSNKALNLAGRITEPASTGKQKIFSRRGGIKPSPYTRVIKSKKYGDFNFTKEAEESLDEYKNLCKKIGIRKEDGSIIEYSIEIPAVGLVNKKNEIVKLLSPPAENILPLSIDINEVYDYNKENIFLMDELKKVIHNPDQRDDIIQKIIANSVYHPLGRFCLGKENDKIIILAEVFNQKVFLPAHSINIPLHSLIDKKENISSMSDSKIIELINRKSLNYPRNEFKIMEEFPLRKNWYIVTTPNTCYWTDYFMNYIEMQSKNMDLKAKAPIHLHPWREMQWLLGTPGEYWIKELQIYLLPSGKDLEFFISRYSDANIYIILGKDPYSDDLNWAVYDDIDLITKEIRSLETVKGDNDKIRIILEDVKNTRGTMQRYYAEKKKGLIVDKEIDDLLALNKRQAAILSEIEEYKKKYSWRLFNASFFIPLLNDKLAKKGWKIASGKNESLGYDLDKKEFYFSEGAAARMDLFLFILFKMCCLDTDDLSIGLKKEAYTIEFLKEICNQLDYLCIKYYHLEELAEHMKYLADDIRLFIWDREKAVLIAKEQINNGKYYLNRYNLGYYPNAEPNDLKPIAEMIYLDKAEGIEIEGIIKELSKKHDVKNIEEFVMRFEERLMAAVLDNIRGE